MNENYYIPLKLSARNLEFKLKLDYVNVYLGYEDLTTKRTTSNWIYILTMHTQLLFCTFMRVGGYFESKKKLVQLL